MSRNGEFLIYCIEIYKNAKSLSGNDVLKLFGKYNADSYILDNFEALHLSGEKYIIADIDDFIAHHS